MSAAPQSVRVTAADRSLRRELGATLALGWPIILANLAINVMTATDFIMLGRLSPHALAAGSLGFFRLSAPVPLRPRRRRSVVSYRRRQARRGPRQGRATARDAPSAYLCDLLLRRRVDCSHRRGPVPARDRRARRRRPGRGDLSQRIPMGPGAEPHRTTRRGPRFRRSSVRAQRSSQDFWPSRSTPLPIMR